jgi:hypothetical protein
MKDTELHPKVLRLFYDRRKGNAFCPWENDFSPPIPQADLYRICDQLGNEGLIKWKPIKTFRGIEGGSGEITTYGVEAVAAGEMLGSSLQDAFLARDAIVYALSKQPNFNKAAFANAIKDVLAKTASDKEVVRAFLESLLNE